MKLSIGAILAGMALTPFTVRAQSRLDLLQSMQTGGGWVQIPIHGGHGTISTHAVPTVGLKLQGCFQVYAGQTGRWEIHARDLLGDGDLDVHVAPGEPTRFSYQTGARSRLDVDVRWSEPRDTTLLMWVGLRTPLQPNRDPCAPVYGGG